MPIFWLGLMLLFVFYAHLGWAPGPEGRIDIGIDPPTHITGLYILDSLLRWNVAALISSITHLILPAICLATPTLAMVMRMIRSSMLEVLTQDYIRTARAKGLSEHSVIYKHALRNALIPTTTLVGLQFGVMFAGAVLTETIFAWPGMGRYVYDAICYSDTAAIMGFTLVVAIIFVFINLVVDLLYGVLDPRVRYG
jgi:peptide/nickel transport system permease protein